MKVKNASIVCIGLGLCGLNFESKVRLKVVGL